MAWALRVAATLAAASAYVHGTGPSDFTCQPATSDTSNLEDQETDDASLLHLSSKFRASEQGATRRGDVASTSWDSHSTAFEGRDTSEDGKVDVSKSSDRDT